MDDKRHYEIGEWYSVDGEKKQLASIGDCSQNRCSWARKNPEKSTCFGELNFLGGPVDRCGLTAYDIRFPRWEWEEEKGEEVEMKDKAEEYEAGKTYLTDAGSKVVCTGFEKCEWMTNNKNDRCHTCPGYPVWNSFVVNPRNSESKCFKNGVYKLDLTLVSIESTESRIERIIEQAIQEVRDEQGKRS